MKIFRLIAVLTASHGGAATGAAADATTPVDPASRNTPFAPAATVTPAKKDLTRNETVQEKRVEKATVDKTLAPVGDRRAAVTVGETREKNIREKDSKTPVKVEQPMNAFNHREAAIATASDTKRPPVVAKFQDKLDAASATNMARYPAASATTTAKINRFVFVKNSAGPTPADATATATPAGGANPVRP